MVRDVNREYDLPLFTVPARKFLTVSELNELIKGTLESQLDAIWVQGEISNRNRGVGRCCGRIRVLVRIWLFPHSLGTSRRGLTNTGLSFLSDIGSTWSTVLALARNWPLAAAFGCSRFK